MNDADADEFYKVLAHETEFVLATAHGRTFAEGVHQYRQIEAKFIERCAGDESLILETRRRIAEMILREANIQEQPFQVCQNAWNELTSLGFSNDAVASTMAWYYGNCCLLNEEFNTGIAALKPVMTELRRLINEPTMSWRTYHQDGLTRLEKLFGELKAGIRE
jgi:hypothetical protein